MRDTRAEWRRYVSKRLLDKSYSEMLQADKEEEKGEGEEVGMGDDGQGTGEWSRGKRQGADF